MFYPLLTGEQHAGRAVEAGGPWLPIGAGVHTGMAAWVGAVGQGSQTELTALGDTVNIAARLASSGACGQVLVTTEAAKAAGLDPQLERRSLELKGKQQLTEVVTLTLGPAA
jgi:adenylate cyclase